VNATEPAPPLPENNALAALNTGVPQYPGCGKMTRVTGIVTAEPLVPLVVTATLPLQVMLENGGSSGAV
jgi:hypothetical protein